MPDPKPKSELEQVNKLVFRMAAASTDRIKCDPRAEYKDGKIAAALQECKAAKTDMEAKLSALGSDPAALEIKASMDKTFTKLGELDADLKTKFGDWMGNKRQMDKTAIWDPAFKEVNQSMAELHDKINQAAKASPDNEQLKEMQASAKVLNSDHLQNKVFTEEVSRLNRMLNEQSRSDYGYKVADQLGYSSDQGAKRLWNKVHSSDAEKIEKAAAKKAEEMAAADGSAPAAVIRGEDKDENWAERLAKKGGPGIYRQPGSDFYMQVGVDASIKAIYSPESSFADKAVFPLMLLASPVLMVAAALSYFNPFGGSKDFRENISNYFFGPSFEKGFDELIDFASIDPSGMMKSQSIEMYFTSYANLGSDQANQILIALKLAEKRGLGFDLAGPPPEPGLAAALAASTKISQSKKEEIFSKIEAYKISFKAAEQVAENKGEKMMHANSTTPPAPGSTSTSSTSSTAAAAPVAITDAEMKVVKESSVALDEMKADLAGEMKAPDVEKALKGVEKAKDAIDPLLPKVNRADGEQCVALNKAISSMENNLDEIKRHAGEMKDDLDDDVEPRIVRVEEFLVDAGRAVVQREEELPLQRDLEKAMLAMDVEGADPDRYAKAEHAFREVLGDALEQFDMNVGIMAEPDNIADNYGKTDNLKVALEAAMHKLDELKPDDKALIERFDAASTQFDEIPRPGPSLALS